MNNYNESDTIHENDWNYESKTSDQIKKEEDTKEFLNIKKEIKQLYIKENQFKLSDILFKTEEEIDECSREFYEFVYK